MPSCHALLTLRYCFGLVDKHLEPSGCLCYNENESRMFELKRTKNSPEADYFYELS